MDNFTPEQIVTLGLVVTVLVSLFNASLQYMGGERMSKKQAVLVVYAVSLALALWFKPELIPALPVLDASAEVYAYPVAYLSWAIALLTAALGQFATATILYVYIMERVEKALGDKFFK